MSARYSPAATRGNSAAPAAAPARLPCSARHQLWHLVTPLLRALLLLLSGLAAAGPARAQQTFTTFQAASQVVARLCDGAVVSGQAYTLGFDGRHLATGLYVCRLVLNGKAEMLRLTVAR